MTTTNLARPPRKRVVCFSFAAYAKSLIAHLQSLNIHVLPGLTYDEFSTIESTLNLRFPPDLRSILQEGLPVGPHFPNWRSSSEQQLRILTNLPLLNLFRNISSNNFWAESWGDRPDSVDEAVKKAKLLIDNAPVLVPVYRNCYIPSTPNESGNPVFYIDDRELRVVSYDITRFFQEIEFLQMGVLRSVELAERLKPDAPAWGVNSERRIDFWTETAEQGRRMVAREPTSGWWWTRGVEGLGRCLEEVYWRLRDGGWRDDEVREMMMMMDGSNDLGLMYGGDGEFVGWRPGVLAVVLLNAGWSTEDVVYSFDLDDDHQVQNSHSIENVDHRTISINQLKSLEV